MIMKSLFLHSLKFSLFIVILLIVGSTALVFFDNINPQTVEGMVRKGWIAGSIFRCVVYYILIEVLLKTRCQNNLKNWEQRTLDLEQELRELDNNKDYTEEEKNTLYDEIHQQVDFIDNRVITLKKTLQQTGFFWKCLIAFELIIQLSYLVVMN